MNKHFYSHIIEIDILIIKIEKLNFSDTEKKNLITLVEHTINHKVLDTVLSELEEKEKSIFLKFLAQDDHNKIWDHLKERIIDIEIKVKNAANEVIEEFHKDIEKVL